MKKFLADIAYGMLASGSSLLTKVAQELCEDSRKINVVDRLSRHLAEDDFSLSQDNYLQLINICMAFLGNMERKSPTNKLRNAIIEAADPIKMKVHFQYYRIASGIGELLKHAKEGVRLWFKTLRPDQRQLRIKFT